MTIQPPSNDQAVLAMGNSIRPTPTTPDSQTEAGTRTSTAMQRQQPAVEATSVTIAAQTGRIQAEQSVNSTAARGVRALDQASKQIDAMKQSLNAIIKNYPPFLQGSEERIKLLMSFNEIRKQIEALTYPPEITAQSLQAQKIWSDLFSGMQIPALADQPTNDATDAQIISTINTLDAAQKTVSDRRQTLAASLPQLPISPSAAISLSSTVGAALQQGAVPLTSGGGGYLKSV
ncbi:hypothetical protein OR1_01941 [Geobacter sp. OR-1]|uniref:hypothetical protein n=1 Tax=Geobacter sp. OR-1 TaxID=1266765 RepID=UPI0005423968|nr:hypothetical protein [Geobacter sp. OR-1]GAM09661.1 hypothetical protein OR1_01941 [Geobacter sp. OR-1]